MSYNLFLDDFRVPSDSHKYTGDRDFLLLEWEIARSYNDFVRVITEKHQKGEFPAMIAFDHDLDDAHYNAHLNWKEYYQSQEREMTGYDCAKWLIDFCSENNLPLPAYKVHSMNPIGKANIVSILENFKKHR